MPKAHPAVDTLVAPLMQNPDPTARAERAAQLAKIRRAELVLYWQLLGEAHKPRPRLEQVIANDEAYQMLMFEAHALRIGPASLQASELDR